MMMPLVMMMKISFLSGTMLIKNGRLRGHKLRKNFCPLPGIHQDGGIGVCLMTRKKGQKNSGSNRQLF